MKKDYSLCAIAAALLLFSSCHKDPENHTLYVVYPNPALPYESWVYADQELDSIVFETFDSYNTTSLVDWITIKAGASYEVNYDYRNLYAFTTLLSFEPNTTGKTRMGSVRIDSYDYSSAAVFYQFGFMDIRRPEPLSTTVADSVSFDLYVPFVATEDSICFNVSKPWTLSYAENADQSWVVFDKAQGAAGDTKIILTLTPNTDTENGRTSVLALKCGEVTNLINIRQEAAIKTTEE